MALNPNHTVEELGTIKCSIIEKNCKSERVSFLKELLSFNGFEVIIVNSPPPKTPAKPVTTDEESAITTPSPASETFTIGVTDLTFNPINAIYNRELKTHTKVIVTPGYWKQQDIEAQSEEWYWL